MKRETRTGPGEPLKVERGPARVTRGDRVERVDEFPMDGPARTSPRDGAEAQRQRADIEARVRR